MCEVMCVALFVIGLCSYGTTPAILYASVGFAVAGGLYRIGRGIERAFGKKDDSEISDSDVA